MHEYHRDNQPWRTYVDVRIEGKTLPVGLEGVECLDEAQPPEGWTKWNIPGYEYLCAKVETENTFSEVKNKSDRMGIEYEKFNR